jgi:hypothetical protein
MPRRDHRTGHPFASSVRNPEIDQIAIALFTLSSRRYAMIRFAAMRSVGWRAGALALWLTACCGCGDGAPTASSSTEEATVHGIVRIDGKPASGGKITFRSANIARNTPDVSAEVGEDGSYTIKAYVGENQIRVTPPANRKTKGSGMYSIDVFAVQSGDNTHDLSLVQQ